MIFSSSSSLRNYRIHDNIASGQAGDGDAPNIPWKRCLHKCCAEATFQYVKVQINNVALGTWDS